MTTLTQAQIEAAAKAMMFPTIAKPSGYWLNKAEAALTAAQVGESDNAGKLRREIHTLRNALETELAATIERCAQVADAIGADDPDGWCITVAAAIRKLRDGKQLDPNLIYPGKDLTNTFPQEE